MKETDRRIEAHRFERAHAIVRDVKTRIRVPSSTIRPREALIKVGFMSASSIAPTSPRVRLLAQDEVDSDHVSLTNSSSLTSTRIASISRAFGEQSQVIIEAGTSTALSAD